MATKKQILDSKLAQFNQKYGLNITESSLDIRVANSDPVNVSNNYQQLSTSVLLEYLSSAMKMRANASYDFTQFSIPEFAEEFEEVMKAKADVQGIGNRQPYEGVKLDELFDSMKEESAKYSYPIAELWQKDFMSGMLTLESMKLVTRDAAGVLLGENADAPDKMSQRSKNALQSLVAAKQTMEAIREQRGIRWILRHPILNYRERKYLKELNKNVKKCEEKRFDVEECANALKNETLQDTFDNLNNHDAYDYRWEGARKENQKIHEEYIRNGVVYGVVEHYESKVNDKAFESEITRELIGVLPVGGIDKSAKAKLIQDKAKSLIDLAHSLNSNYRNSINSTNVELEMDGYTTDIFMHAFKMLDTCKYNLKGRLLAAQRMTDIIMNKLSPVPLAREALGKYADGYVLANHKSIDNRVSLYMAIDEKNKAEVITALQEADGLYQSIKNGREPLEFPADTFTEVPKSEEPYYVLKEESIDPFEIFNTDPFGGAMQDSKISQAQKEEMEKERQLNNSKSGGAFVK